MKETITITVRRAGDARGQREFTANLTAAQLKDDDGRLLLAALRACRKALDQLDAKPDWTRIKAIAQEAQRRIDAKPKIKGVTHSMRNHIHRSRMAAMELGYRGTEDDWQEFMRRHG